MSDLTAKVTKDSKGSIQVEGYEALKYNFHYTSPVFDIQHDKLAAIYERWARVLIVMDTSESLCSALDFFSYYNTLYQFAAPRAHDINTQYLSYAEF